MRRGDETLDGPPIPLMTQGMCLTMEEFEEAYSTLEANITKFPCEDTGAHVELDYLVARMSSVGGTLSMRVSLEGSQRTSRIISSRPGLGIHRIPRVGG